jgi:hypothetical protein
MGLAARNSRRATTGASESPTLFTTARRARAPLAPCRTRLRSALFPASVPSRLAKPNRAKSGQTATMTPQTVAKSISTMTRQTAAAAAGLARCRTSSRPAASGRRVASSSARRGSRTATRTRAMAAKHSSATRAATTVADSKGRLAGLLAGIAASGPALGASPLCGAPPGRVGAKDQAPTMPLADEGVVRLRRRGQGAAIRAFGPLGFRRPVVWIVRGRPQGAHCGCSRL